MSTTSQDIELHLPGMTLAAKVWGPEDGRPVLAGHGWLDNAASFDRLAPLLDGLRIVALDFPGHGRSEHRRRGESYHFVDLVPVYVDAADTLGWETFTLMSHSMGAAAALLAAGTFPERVERMVLIDGLGPWTTAPDDAPGQLARGIEERKTLLHKRPRIFATRQDAVDTIAKLYGLTSEHARPLLERGLVACDDAQGWRFSYDLMLRGASLLRLTEDHVLAFLERIVCPTLLIRPTEGWPADEDFMERRTGAIEPLEIIEVEGNHHVHLAHPECLVEPIAAFMHDDRGR